MNSAHYLDRASRIERDIADLQKRIADESRKELDKSRQISSIESTITSNLSQYSIDSKRRQMQSYQRNIIDIKRRVSDLQRQIADKNQELSRVKTDLRRAEENERKKDLDEQSKFRRQLEKSISIQKEQLATLIAQNYSAQNDNSQKAANADGKEYDFFISHASEDKDEIVRELADALRSNGIRVWYDEFVLRVGDSLRKSIDTGLIKSKYGIVIISPNFIAKKWPEYELNGMIAREMDGHKVVLPIWHKVSKNEVINFSPSLADKLALNTAIHTINEIVNSLKEFL
jgi:hypothetical protein